MAYSSHEWKKWLECDKDSQHMMEVSYLSADKPPQFIVDREKPTEDDSGHPVLAGSTATIILTPGHAVWIKYTPVENSDSSSRKSNQQITNQEHAYA